MGYAHNVRFATPANDVDALMTFAGLCSGIGTFQACLLRDLLAARWHKSGRTEVTHAELKDLFAEVVAATATALGGVVIEADLDSPRQTLMQVYGFNGTHTTEVTAIREPSGFLVTICGQDTAAHCRARPGSEKCWVRFDVGSEGTTDIDLAPVSADELYAFQRNA